MEKSEKELAREEILKVIDILGADGEPRAEDLQTFWDLTLAVREYLQAEIEAEHREQRIKSDRARKLALLPGAVVAPMPERKRRCKLCHREQNLNTRGVCLGCQPIVCKACNGADCPECDWTGRAK